MEFIPNVDEAKRFVHSYWFYSNYSAAYIVTNEFLHDSMQYVPKNCNKALVTAASGDHPLFCSLYGAKHVDTFDISYNAKCIMDIKTAAIKCLDHSEYIDLLCNLYDCRDVTRVHNMDKIANNLSPTEYKYMCSMFGYALFSNRQLRDKNDKFLISQQDYEKLQKIVKKPYNFTMTNIGRLGIHLTESYDFIHLSNILDYMEGSVYRFLIVSRLFNHVNVGGRIISTNMCGKKWPNDFPVEEIEKNIEGYEDSLARYTNVEDFLKESMMKSKKELEQMREMFKNWRYAKITDFEDDIIVFERVR